MRRMVERSVRLGIDHVSKSLLQRDPGRPCRRLLEFPRVADKIPDVARPHQRWVGDRLYPHTHQVRQPGEELPQGDTFTTRNIVRFARHAVLQQSNVGADYIANIQKVANRLEVSGRDTVDGVSARGAEAL